MSLKNSALSEIQNNISEEKINSFLSNEENITLFNIESTTRCNNACTYCHIYNGKYDRKCGKDIDDVLFEEYMNFISYFKNNSETLVQWRMSGGDPIVLGDRLFSLAEKGYKITGIEPYILTAGKGITEERILKARKSPLQNAFISVENPFDPDPGANKTENVVQAVKNYNHPDFQLILGVCIIKNKYFGKLLEICDYFYNETGQIPTLHELNYESFEQPTQEELNLLREQIEQVLNKYKDKVLIRMFPSVFPELSFGGKMVYLSDLPINDSHNFFNKTNKERLLYMARRFIGFSYPDFECEHPCEFKDFCNNVKWFRQYNSNGILEHGRKETYCKLKQMLAEIYLSTFE